MRALVFGLILSLPKEEAEKSRRQLTSDSEEERRR